MSGLLKKDLYLLKSGWKSYVLMVAIYAVCGLVANPVFFNTMMITLLLTLPMNAFSVDEQAKWDGYAAALPGGRRTMVSSKYQLVLLTAGAILVLAFVVDGIISLKEGVPYGELMVSALAAAALGLVANWILCPLMFKYGVAKARISMLICVGAIIGLLMVGTTMSFGGSLFRAFTAGGWVVVVLLLLAAVAVGGVVSYRTSCSICEKREF